MKKIGFHIAVALILLLTSEVQSTILVYEDFDDRAYKSPLTFYNVTGYDQSIIFDAENAIGNSGFCLKWDHSNGYLAGIGVLNNFTAYAADGIYIRYWVRYSPEYYFPGDQGLFENLKMFKLGEPGAPVVNGHDIEFIYKDTVGGPKRLQLFWIKSDGSIAGGTGTGNTAIGSTMEKGAWHKIEIFLKIAVISEVQVQINDTDVYKNTNADINLPLSAYSGTQQFMSIRASNHPPSGHGVWFTDNITIIHNEGNLCDNEPVEPGSLTPLSPPENLRID